MLYKLQSVRRGPLVMYFRGTTSGASSAAVINGILKPGILQIGGDGPVTFTVNSLVQASTLNIAFDTNVTIASGASMDVAFNSHIGLLGAAFAGLGSAHLTINGTLNTGGFDMSGGDGVE